MACNRLLCSIPRRMGIYACGEQQISNKKHLNALSFLIIPDDFAWRPLERHLRDAESLEYNSHNL